MGAVQNTNAFWMCSMRRIVRSGPGRRCMYVLGGIRLGSGIDCQRDGNKDILVISIADSFPFSGKLSRNQVDSCAGGVLRREKETLPAATVCYECDCAMRERTCIRNRIAGRSRRILRSTWA